MKATSLTVASTLFHITHHATPVTHVYSYLLSFSSDGCAPWPQRTARLAHHTLFRLRLCVWQHDGTSFGCCTAVSGNRWSCVQRLRGQRWVAEEELLVLPCGRTTEAQAEAGPIIPVCTITTVIMFGLFFELG